MAIQDNINSAIGSAQSAMTLGAGLKKLNEQTEMQNAQHRVAELEAKKELHRAEAEYNASSDALREQASNDGTLKEIVEAKAPGTSLFGKIAALNSTSPDDILDYRLQKAMSDTSEKSTLLGIANANAEANPKSRGYKGAATRARNNLEMAQKAFQSLVDERTARTQLKFDVQIARERINALKLKGDK